MQIKDIKNSLSTQPKEEDITHAQAKKAFLLLKTMSLNTKDDYFLFLSSINLLNSYTKKDYASSEFKKSYKHKQFIEQAVDSAIEDDKKVLTFSDNKHGKNSVLIVNIDDVQFSFHSVKTSARMDYIKRENFYEYQKQDWNEVKLQPQASSLFENSTKLNELSQETIVGVSVDALLDQVDKEFEIEQEKQNKPQKENQEDTKIER
jgi:hypothetical protein